MFLPISTARSLVIALFLAVPAVAALVFLPSPANLSGPILWFAIMVVLQLNELDRLMGRPSCETEKRRVESREN